MKTNDLVVTVACKCGDDKSLLPNIQIFSLLVSFYLVLVNVFNWLVKAY